MTPASLQSDEGSTLEIDEELSLLGRIERYCTSDVPLLRLVHVREIVSCAEQIGVSGAVSRLVPLLKIIACDPDESVRQACNRPFFNSAPILDTWTLRNMIPGTCGRDGLLRQAAALGARCVHKQRRC